MSARLKSSLKQWIFRGMDVWDWVRSLELYLSSHLSSKVWESVQYCGLIKKIEPQQFSLYSRSHRRARPGAVMPSGAGRTKRGPQGRTRLNLS